MANVKKKKKNELNNFFICLNVKSGGIEQANSSYVEEDGNQNLQNENGDLKESLQETGNEIITSRSS